LSFTHFLGYPPLRYTWIKANRNDFSIIVLCNFMNVSRSCYYEWLNRPISNRDQENKILTKMIKEIFTKNRHIYGTRRISEILAKNNIFISRNKIGKLMAKSDLSCKTKRKFKVTTDSKHNRPISPNLLNREFDVTAPDTYWVGDITYTNSHL